MKRSAGLLVWRRRADRTVEVLLAHPGGPWFARKDDGAWSIPKGELEPGEEPVAAAHREFAEELGIAPPDGDLVALGEARQSGGGKVNTVWAVEGSVDLAGFLPGTFPLEWPPRSGRLQQFPEVDRAAWFALEQARAKVFSSQLPFLDRLAAHLGLGASS